MPASSTASTISGPDGAIMAAMPAPATAKATVTRPTGPTAMKGRPTAISTPPSTIGARRPRRSDQRPASGTSSR